MTPEELHNIRRTEAEFWWYRGMRDIMAAFLDQVPAQTIRRALDAGCGTGFNALAWEQRYRFPIYGVDIARLAIQYCREQGFIRCVNGSVLDIPFADDSFDLVATLDVLSHVPEGTAQKALQEFARVLRPGRWLLIRVPAFRALRSQHSVFIAETHRYVAGEMKSMLKAAGFTVARWSYANTFLSPVAFAKFRIWEKLSRSLPHSGVEEIPPPGLNRVLFSVLKMEAALIRSGFRLPFGQSLIVLARKNVSASRVPNKLGLETEPAQC